MYNLIRTSLRKPISVIVLVAGLLFFSLLSVVRIPVDIFPSLNLPVIYVIQPYGGMAPDQLDGFIATRYQDHFLYVSGIKDIEVKSIQGLCLIRLQFHPDANMSQAAAEVANNVARAKAYMPEGTVPPQVVRFDASSVPVGQLVFSSTARPLNEIQDLAASRVRPMFSKIEGVSSPPPFGGNQRTIVIKINPDQMRNYRLTAEEVIDVITANNQPSPAGNIRIGDKTMMSPANSLIRTPEDFLQIPVRTENGHTLFVHDIATVEDDADITVSYALINGKRAVYIPVVKKADASTLSVVQNIRNALPALQQAVPEDVQISYEFDQSSYVTNALKNLLTEGVLGALLTGLMVFLFLKDWRSVVVVIVTIPLSILSAVLCLYLFGHTINIMTLSGLALSVGILVDEATVTIENIHQHLELQKPKAVAIWDACKEIAFPKLLILLVILAVFVPSLVMQGIPRSMFLPLSLSVGFAMIASFLLSQSLVPVLSNWLLRPIVHTPSHKGMSGFDKFKKRYLHFLNKTLSLRKTILPAYLLLSFAFAGFIYSYIGTDILPKSNNSQFQIRLRTPDGTRIERTEKATLELLDLIRTEAGVDNVLISLAYVGTVPTSYGTSNVFVFNRGPHEAIVQVALKYRKGLDMEIFKNNLRQKVATKFPELQISFEPMELVEKIMSQGSATPIEVTVASKDLGEAYKYAQRIEYEMKKNAFLKDIQIAQPMAYPILNIEIDREKSSRLGLELTQVMRSLTTATSSSRFITKNLWLDEQKGLAYQVQIQVPENKISSPEDLGSIPLKPGTLSPVLADVATFAETKAPGSYDRSGSNRLVTITANVFQKDLGSAHLAVSKAIDRAGNIPRGVLTELRGQTTLLSDILSSLGLGLCIAVVVIFLLLSANFQSFRLALVVLSSVPAVLTGALSLLWLCGSTLNLQSYMGIIMSVGVSVANALLLITAAEAIRLTTQSAYEGAWQAASGRLRPILMTSIAMMAGMLPMALGLGEGGEQAAPLGQAIIGGLLASTIATLLILPACFQWIQQKTSLVSVSLDPEDPDSPSYYSEYKTS
jgi:multidrug efflux pump subunit AcrB